MRLAVIIGHNHRAQGATATDGVTEYDFNSRVAKLMAARGRDHGVEVTVIERQPGGAEIDMAHLEAARAEPDAIVELHFNAAKSPAATGTETLHAGRTPDDLRLALEMQREMLAALGLRDRGVKQRTGGRGAKMLTQAPAPCVIVEPFFGSCPSDVEAATPEALADAYLRAAAEYGAGLPRRTLDESRTIEATTKTHRAAATGAWASIGQAIVAMLAVLVGDATTAQDAATNALWWAQYLPIGAAVLAISGLVAFAVVKRHSQAVEAARIDDHDRGLR